jgi:hypothetical protein
MSHPGSEEGPGVINVSGDRPPFDPVRAAFFLIAGVIGTYCIVVLISVLSCLWYIDTIMKNPEIVCDPKSRLTELLSAALAAALAFAGGTSRKP